jgi:hypothetical protein
VGHLYRDGEELGLLLVRVDIRATAVAGRWWWTKWSPTFDSVWEWVLLDGQFSDHVVAPEDAEQALQDYADGRYLLRGETLRLEWATPAESARLREEAFGAETAHQP